MAVSMWGKLVKHSLFIFIIELYFIEGKRNIVQLNEDNWSDMLDKEWMVEFYAPWCPACKTLQPVWEEFSTWSDDLSIKVGQIDVTTSPGLSGRFMVTALPTIFHVLDGEFRLYRGGRDKDAFISFVEEKKWKTIDTIPSWKSPASLQMSVVSYVFQVSQVLRAVHNKLMEDYGVPTWGSYLIFALTTIVIGAIIGLVLVCVLDFIYPPKPMTHTPTDIKYTLEKAGQENDIADGKEASNNELEEDDDDDDLIKDDLVDEEGSDAAATQSGSDAETKEEEGSPSVRKRKSRKAD